MARGRKREAEDGTPRERRASVRFTLAEWRWLEAQARKAGRTVSAFLRRRVLRGMG